MISVTHGYPVSYMIFNTMVEKVFHQFILCEIYLDVSCNGLGLTLDYKHLQYIC